MFTLYLSEFRSTNFKSVLIILAEFVRSAAVNCCCWLNMHKSFKDNGACFSEGHSRIIRLAALSTKITGCRDVEIWSERNDVIVYFDITFGLIQQFVVKGAKQVDRFWRQSCRRGG